VSLTARSNAVAESTIGLYKTELITARGPWRTVEDVELATLAWVDWFNHRRLLWPIGGVPPAEFEARWLAALENQPTGASGSPSDCAGGIKAPDQLTLIEATETQ
jgi:putative transposase